MPSKSLFKRCVYCQEMMGATSRYCPKCNTKQPGGHAWKWVMGIVVVFLGVQLLGGDGGGDGAVTPQGQERTKMRLGSGEDFRGLAYPDSQSVFASVVLRHREKFQDARNEVQESVVRDNRSMRLASTIPGRQAVRWVGTVSTLGTNSEGKGILSVEVADNVFVKTWNNALSDIGSETLIDKSSAVYREMMNLQPGDQVSFSGEFLSSELDYLEESSLTIEGSMTEPEYLFRFASLQAVN